MTDKGRNNHYSDFTYTCQVYAYAFFGMLSEVSRKGVGHFAVAGVLWLAWCPPQLKQGDTIEDKTPTSQSQKGYID